MRNMPFLFTPYYLLSIYHLWLELENGQLLNLIHHELKYTLWHRGAVQTQSVVQYDGTRLLRSLVVALTFWCVYVGLLGPWLELPEAIIASDHVLALLTDLLAWLHPSL